MVKNKSFQFCTYLYIVLAHTIIGYSVKKLAQSDVKVQNRMKTPISLIFTTYGIWSNNYLLFAITMDEKL